MYRASNRRVLPARRRAIAADHLLLPLFCAEHRGQRMGANVAKFRHPALTFPSGVVINELHINEDDPTIHSEFIELQRRHPRPSTWAVGFSIRD
jgi:hypothetical protein